MIKGLVTHDRTALMRWGVCHDQVEDERDSQMVCICLLWLGLIV